MDSELTEQQLFTKTVQDWVVREAPQEWARELERHEDRFPHAFGGLIVLAIRPGVVLRVLERELVGGPLWVEASGQRRTMGAPLAHLVHEVIAS